MCECCPGCALQLFCWRFLSRRHVHVHVHVLTVFGNTKLVTSTVWTLHTCLFAYMSVYKYMYMYMHMLLRVLGHNNARIAMECGSVAVCTRL